MNIYFAGSIRGGRDDKDLYLAIIDLLRNYGTMLTEHVGDKTLSAQGEQTLTEEFIYERDMSWLNSSDVVVYNHGSRREVDRYIKAHESDGRRRVRARVGQEIEV
jgi:nucleoside 2-deoxyribosyltransferase